MTSPDGPQNATSAATGAPAARPGLRPPKPSGPTLVGTRGVHPHTATRPGRKRALSRKKFEGDRHLLVSHTNREHLWA